MAWSKRCVYIYVSIFIITGVTRSSQSGHKASLASSSPEFLLSGILAFSVLCQHAIPSRSCQRRASPGTLTRRWHGSVWLPLPPWCPELRSCIWSMGWLLEKGDIQPGTQRPKAEGVEADEASIAGRWGSLEGSRACDFAATAMTHGQ